MAAKKKSSDNQYQRAKPARQRTVKKQTSTSKQAATTASETLGTQGGSPDTTVIPQSESTFAQRFSVVGLGASAGGLEALEEFFRCMPATSGMAFVVVMHQAAKHVSLLPDLLDKCTKMEVAAIEDGMRVLPNHVYVVPPGKNVDLLAGRLHLTDLPAKHAAPLPIDYFFRSLAAERREMAVAIVLSGTGTDGTVGLSAIKGESGMVVVQSVESAKFSGMPQHAIDAGWADYVLPPDAMPARLVAYARGPFVKAPPSLETPTPAIHRVLPDILLKLRRRCGHDFSGYKTSTICRRIERRMNVHQIDDPKQYLKYLDHHEPEAATLFKELLIGVTSFFRDPWAFEALAAEAIMPRLKEKTEDSQFRVWVPGCATGEEGYSIAMLLRECLDNMKLHLNVQVFATDLDADAIETARAGLFPSGIGTDVSAERLGKFFRKEDGGYKIRKELRDWLVFAPQNVIHDPPFTKLDLISCRNLLIYMQPDLQRKLLSLFHYALNPGGCMFLGTSESISEFNDLFGTLNNKAKIFRRIESAHPDRDARFPVVGSESPRDRTMSSERNLGAPNTVREAITGMLASDFAPPTVVVTEHGEIVHVHGRTGKFLELAPGGPPKNIVAMAREGLGLDLSSALRTAARQDRAVVHENVAVKTNGDTELINLVAQKIANPASLRGLLRISFVAVKAAVPAVAVDGQPPQGKPKQTPTVRARELELELELQKSRDSLQRTIEELDASNEEMKSANEELQSTNEELQSTNEELETSKEELQSLNEELQTVNAELQEKIRQLSSSNDDMNNLLNSTDIATLFLDNGLCIKRYTEQAKQIVRVIPTDVGRALGDLTSRLRYDALMSDCQQVLKSLIPIEREVQTEDDKWLLMRILPYRTSEDRIHGLVMTFVDIDESKRVRDEVATYTKNIVETVREPLLVLDGGLYVQFANRSFYETFQLPAERTLGNLIYELGDRQWDIPALRELLEEILPQNSSFDDFAMSYDLPGSGSSRLLLNARRILSATGQASLILLAIEKLRA